MKAGGRYSFWSRGMLVALSLTVAFPAFAQMKPEERLAHSVTVMNDVLLRDNGLPSNILDKAVCVSIFPSVKRVAIGIGVSYGRGVLVCRQGLEMDGAWSAPAMYKLDQGSLGVQLGTTDTDLVLAVMNKKGADQILNGKTKLGANAAVAAGPTGAQATAYDATAMKADVLSYSRSKGVFVGISLEGASLENDRDANKSLYGSEIGARDIVTGNQPVPPAGKPLVDLLDQYSIARK